MNQWSRDQASACVAASRCFIAAWSLRVYGEFTFAFSARRTALLACTLRAVAFSEMRSATDFGSFA